MDTYYLVGIMKDPPDSRPKWNGMFILLRSSDFQLALCDGPDPRDEGSVTSVANWLEQRPFQRWFYSQPIAPGMESPGWFERECGTAGCAWFIPIAKRIAAREPIRIEEITAVYSANKQGRSMPCGTIAELFDNPLQGKAYFLGAVPSDSNENTDRDGWVLSYLPDGSEYLEGIPLIDFRKPQRRFEGRVAEASNWLDYRPSNWRQVGVALLEEQMQPGWFVRLCSEIGCSWFVPMVERLAVLEKVRLEEITAAYSANNDGHPMPNGTFEDLFAFAKKINQPRN